MSKEKKMEEIKIFTYDYVDELQRKVEINDEFSDYLNDSFKYHEKFPKGNTGVFIDEEFELKMQDHSNNYDLENSIIFYENVKGMNPTIASDSRLWTYLTHVRFWKYMRNRWPINGMKSPKGRIIDRYHLKYLKLESLTRNGLSRLWWYVHLTFDNKRKDKYELTRILLSRAEIAVGILERAYGSNKNVRISVLEFLNENEDISKDEDLTRDLLVKLNLLGGVKNLPLLEVYEIKDYLYKIKSIITS